MKKLLLLLLLPALFISCISSGEDITVNKDGSGQIVQTFKIIKDYVGFLNLSDQPSDPNLIDMDELKKNAETMGENVTLEKVVPMPENSPYAGYQAYYTFKDINKITASAAPATSPEAGDIDQKDLIRFEFTPGSTASLVIIMPDKEDENSTASEESADTETKKEDAGMKDQLKQIYKDMHYWIKISVDGKIKKTNARHVDGSTVTILDMSFDKIVDNDELFEKVTSDDSGKNMDEYLDELAAAGVLIEDQDRISVSFK